MTRLPRVRGRQIVQALNRAGFAVTHVRGSHYYLRKEGSEGLVVVPVHGNRDVPAGTLRSILRQAGLTAKDLARLLRG